MANSGARPILSGDVTLAEFPAAAAASDDFANPTTTNILAMLMGFDGATWDRIRALAGDADATTAALAAALTMARTMLYNGATWDRARSAPAADDVAATGIPAAALMGYDGATWDRLRAYANALGVSPVPSGVAAAATSIYRTAGGFETGNVVKAGPGTVYWLRAYNNNGAARFAQLFDAVAVPADATEADDSFAVAATSNSGVIDFGTFGRRFATGISWCNSTTFRTKTIGGADGWVEIAYV